MVCSLERKIGWGRDTETEVLCGNVPLTSLSTVTAGLAKKQTPKEPVSVALHEAGALSLGEQKRPGTGWAIV